MSLGPTAGLDLLAEAGQAERSGDLLGAARLLQTHLGRHGDDVGTRLRLGRLLFTLNEGKAARQILGALEDALDTDIAARAERLLALLDERDGALSAAEIRWERLLVDDIDDAEARAHLRALRPSPQRSLSDPSLATLASPEGIRTSRFRLIRELGRGSTATVYLVRDERLDLPLALKVLHPQLASASRAEARGRFFTEARVAAALRHPGVVAIYDVDEATRSLAMEYLAGGTLRDRLRRRASDDHAATAPARGIEEATVLLDVATSLLDALAYVHSAGVIHGDLKPGNVLLRGPGAAVLADFGIARLVDRAIELRIGGAGGGTAGEQGTPLYLAPEQFHGGPPAVATDLFAAGAILWELATGQPVRSRHALLQSPESLATVMPHEPFLPLGPTGLRLRALIQGLAAARPEDRPRSAALARASLGL